ncbi:hypothetical protein [Lysobacter sp. KIS68-7]|uniref:hypothetical protein n=1 Tax=Lysobacter sp. KIS68-7 TaxID=2904252 RepID=UPI0031BB6C8A
MSAVTLLRDALRRARARRGFDVALACLPWIAIATVLAWRLEGWRAASLVALVSIAAMVTLARHRIRRLDNTWLVRELDAQRPELEDSTDLLFAPPDKLTPLERLQVTRLQSRLEAGRAIDVRPGWSKRAIVLGLAFAALSITAILAWPARQPVTFDNVLANIGVATTAPTHTRVVEQQLHVAPPSYTRLPARDTATLDAKAPQGTRLQWTLRFAPQPKAAELVFHDGRRVALARDGDAWHAADVLARSALYRIVLHDAPPLQASTLHRLDAIADRPPELRVVDPDRGLTLMQSGQRSWALAFEGSDDYGLSPNARLRITVAHGSGEAIEFREQEVGVTGAGPATSKRYVRRLDLGALGLAEGDDLVVQLRVDDNRSPGPQSVRSASVILRWPPDLGAEATGVEGMVKKVLPAYFRSQRQIIIDAEALLKQKRTLASERYLKRSDEIGVDQRILRMRYGQFLGEEAEGEPQAPPTNDQTAAPPADDHDHAAAKPADAPAFGQDTAVEQQFGHTHDQPEAATLLDPETRATLKQALDQMWQSEQHLRQGKPEDALPYAYRALGFIKQVQQATRIYLARVGTELPPIDESRRMSGDRAGLARSGDALASATVPDPELAGLWRALDEVPGASSDVDYASLERWLRDHQSELRDPLSFVAAIEALRADPHCVQCRRDLRALLWPLLPRPAANVQRREGDDATSRRYLDALREARAP